MKTPADIKTEVEKKVKRHRRAWLKDATQRAAAVDGASLHDFDDLCQTEKPAFPLAISLGVPSDKIAADAGWAGLTAWIRCWEKDAGSRPGNAGRSGRVEWRVRHFGSMGEQRVPERIVFETPEEAAARAGAGVLDAWRRDKARIERLTAALPGLLKKGGRGIDFALDFVKAAADWADEEVERFIAVYAWLAANPATNLYLRQLPIPGIHTKWLDAGRKKLFLALHRVLCDGLSQEGATFETVFGLRVKENRLRFRVLDPALRRVTAGLEDLDIPRSEAARLPLTPETVIFSENEQTGLAFPDLPGVVLVLGLGNNVGDLGAIPWLSRARILYWGDLDTYGFDILDNVRAALPQTQSVLMDEATLRRWRDFAVGVSEKEQYRGELAHLTPDEARVVELLQADALGKNLRLEQERIPWAEALAAVKARL